MSKAKRFDGNPGVLINGEEEIVMNQKEKCFWVGVLFLALTLISVGWTEKAQSQAKYPTRPIEIIVPMGPGGATDLTARMIADYLTKKWGVPVNVANKPGGRTIPATLELYKAPPDGCTFLLETDSSSVLMSLGEKELPFKIMDRTFVAIVAVNTQVFLVPSTSPVKSMKDLEAEAKKDPGSFSWASGSGSSSGDHVARQFFKAIDVEYMKTKQVYGSGAVELVTLAAGGNVKMSIASPTAARAAITGGTVRPLAVTHKERWFLLPDIPTTAEQGYPTVNYMWWGGVSGPPKLPSSIIETWNKALEEMSNDSEFIAKLKKIGLISAYQNATEAKESITRMMAEVKDFWR
jgi:tripartite-type tricarboxylate transporter receptor subunit TctC